MKIGYSMIIFFLLAVVFASGFYFGSERAKSGYIKPDPEIRYKVTYRSYREASREALEDLLGCYDTSIPRLDGEYVESIGKYRFTAGLCEREWSRDFEIGERGDFKFYIGLGAGFGLAAGLGLWYIIK